MIRNNTKVFVISLHWVLVPCFAVAMSLWPTLSTGLEQLQTDPGDTVLNLYFLEHAFRHFTSLNVLKPDYFWSPDFFWPVKNTLAWSDHLLGQTIIYGIFRPILEPFQSYVAWLSLTLWLNYISIRFAIQKISPRTEQVWLSLISLVTTFSPAILQQLGHPQLLSLFLIGPILVLGHRLILEPVENFSIRDWFILGSWLITNGFFNIYIFVYSCFGSFTCVLIHVLRRLRSRNLLMHKGKQIWETIAIFSCLTFLNSLIYIPYLQTLRIFGKRSNDEILKNLPKPSSWLFSSDHWLLPGPLKHGTINPDWINGVEQELFPGWVFLILMSAAAITALVSKKRKPNGLSEWLWVIALMLTLSMSFHSISAWPIVSKVLPGASSLRASSRVGMMIILFASPALSLAAQHWQPKLGSPSKVVASFLAIGGGFAGIWATKQPSFSLAAWKDEQIALSNALITSNCSTFWYQWSNQPPWRAHALAMHTQLKTGIPTANGYSGHFPLGNWPYSNPSGRLAFEWIKRNTTKGRHPFRPLTDESKWCIATMNPDGKAMVRGHDHFIIETVQTLKNKIFISQQVSIGAKHGMLYFKDDQSKGRWILITRDGKAINSNRGDFKIVNATKIPGSYHNEILITDRNLSERIEYIWRVDAKTGEFMGQNLKKLPQL